MSGMTMLLETMIGCGLLFFALLYFADRKKNAAKNRMRNILELTLFLTGAAIVLIVFGHILGQYQAARAGHIPEGSIMGLMVQVVDGSGTIMAMSSVFVAEATAMMTAILVFAAASVLFFAGVSKRET